MRGMRKGREKDSNDYRNHFGGGVQNAARSI